MSEEGKMLRLLNTLREAADDAKGCDRVSLPGQSEAGEFYATWEGVDVAVKIEIL